MFLGRAIRRGGLPGLFLLLFFVTIANAAHLAHLDIIWRTPANAAIQSHIESTINVSRGVNISESRLTSLIEATVAVLADHGHHHATIAPRDFRAADDSLSFTLEIDPGPSTRIIKWELLGLARTDSAWLADALSLPTGLTASASVIKDATSRLLSFTNIQLAGPPEVVTTGDDSCVIIQLHLREQTPARFEGALAAGSSEGEEQSLLGRFSLGLNGLFRRGHAIDIQYEHPQPRERLLRLNYSERHALWCNLTSRAQFEDWRRHDHRQRIRTDFSIGPRGHQSLALLLGVNWQKVSPLASTTETSRVYESSAGLSWRRGDVLDLSITSTYSLHRQWETQSGADNSQSRVRIDSEGRAKFDLSAKSRLRLSFGARRWGKGDVVRTGDEWFLGGGVLSGYSDRSIVASEGVWSRIELSRLTNSGFGAMLFGDCAWLSMFDHSYSRPASLGLAFLFESPGRSGRLELAWKDHATLSDGILRLSVVQGW